MAAVNMHKRIAMGERVTGMKRGGNLKGYAKGGGVHDDEAADRKQVRKMVKPEALTGKRAGGTVCKKCGGRPCKC